MAYDIKKCRYLGDNCYYSSCGGSNFSYINRIPIMVKVKIQTNKAIIIDDAESTPGQSRQYDIFEATVLPSLQSVNWKDNFKKLKSAFKLVEEIETDSGVVAKFEMR